jgi:hydrogenase maturation protease
VTGRVSVRRRLLEPARPTPAHPLFPPFGGVENLQGRTRLRAAVLVVGIGNAMRGDDGAGLEVVRRLREGGPVTGVTVCTLEGEGIGLLDAWEGASAVVLVDTVQSGSAPGTVHRLDAAAKSLPGGLRTSSSTHAVGVADAIELARVLGRLPARLVVYGIEGERFDAGAALSAPVAAVIDDVAGRVMREASALARD